MTPVGPAGVLGAGSSSQTVGPLSTIPTTATFQFTATCTNNSFFDSHNPQQIVLLFADKITDVDAPDHHVTDSNAANNCMGPVPVCPTPGSAPITLAFWNRNPNFAPVFTAIIDSTDTAGQTSDPVTIPSTHNCVTNQLTSPTQAASLPGLPCEMYFTSHIPAGNPLALPTVITPEHCTAPGTACPVTSTKGFTIAEGETILNGTITAAFGFNLNVNFGTGCTTTLGAPYPTVALKDGALPGGTTVGDPSTAPYPAEGLDSALAADIASPLVWSTRLNSDPGVMALVALGLPVWTRYTAVDPVLGTPVNILVFNAGTSYYTITITGDPTAAPTPPGQQCTPFDTQTDYLGSVSPGGTVIRTCDDPTNGTNYVFAAKFTRADTFQSVTRKDTTNSCTASDTAITSMVKNETLGATPGTPSETDSGITYTETVTLVLQGSGNLTLSLVGPAVCNPHWVTPILQLFNNTFAGIQTSVITIPSAGPGTVVASYSFNCPPGDFSFQIIANLTPGVGETNTANNQVENHVAVHVIPDLDNDGVPNNLDQCPTVADPEGAGPDPSDTVPSNGCPDTNISIGPVVKEENFNVDVSVDTLKHVDITVNNTEFATPVLVHILAVSQIGQCEVRLVGPTVSNFFTDEDNLAYNSDVPVTHPQPDEAITGTGITAEGSVDTLNSQLELTIPMPINSHIHIGVDYIIHCFQKSTHSPAFELQVDAIPLPPVVEENLGSCTPGTA